MFELEINTSRKPFVINELIGWFLIIGSVMWSVICVFGIEECLYGEEGRDVESAIFFGVMEIVGVIAFYIGARIFIMVHHCKVYSFTIGACSENVLEKICEATGHSKRKVEKNIAYMIKKKYLIPKSSDDNEDSLMSYFNVKDEERIMGKGIKEDEKEFTMDDIDFLLVYENPTKMMQYSMHKNIYYLIEVFSGIIFPLLWLIGAKLNTEITITEDGIIACITLISATLYLVCFQLTRRKKARSYEEYKYALCEKPAGYIKDIALAVGKDETTVRKELNYFIKKRFLFNARLEEDRICARFTANQRFTNKLGVRTWKKIADMTVEKCPHCGEDICILIGITKRCPECEEKL